MRLLAQALSEVLHESPFLLRHLNDELINLTALARKLRPLLKARCKKEISISSIVMTLSRLQRRGEVSPSQQKLFKQPFSNLSLHPGLVSVTFARTSKTRRRLAALLEKLMENEEYLSLSEGVSELTIICSRRLVGMIKKNIAGEVVSETDDLTAFVMKHSHLVVETPGVYAYLLSQLSYQGINLVDLTSTAGELVIYLDSKDVPLAFDTMNRTYSRE